MVDHRGPDAGDVDLPRSRAVRFIVLVGVVSLFADMTYEGARSVTGPYLALLGASGTVVGLVAGFGELLGYALRLGSGYLSDRTGRYWAVTIAGYAINLFAVPLLALANRWEFAVVLILAERAGRAIRTPARDAMLSHAGSQTGLGWAFGLHEALDQTGAVLGPLMVSAVLYMHGGYQLAFACLAIPAMLSLAVLLSARNSYPYPRDFELTEPTPDIGGYPPQYWLYLAAVACIAAGYADFSLIAFHFKKAAIVSDSSIPILYAVAMTSDAIAALLLGLFYDRLGVRSLILATLASLLTAPFAFFGGPAAAVVAMVLWGIGMGAQESVMRAVVAGLTPPARRATAYGVFNAIYGVAWFAGSALLGVLYDVSLASVVAASVLLQGAALPVLWWLGRRPYAVPDGAP